MDEDTTPRARPGSLMTVRELIARLRNANPDFLVVIEGGSQSLMIIDPRPGFCNHEDFEDDSGLSLEDRKFLQQLHIKE